MEITIKHYDLEIKLNLPPDVGVADVAQALRGALISCGYGMKSVEKYIKTE